MKTLQILLLLIAFVVAVILPNEIGTHDQPATGTKGTVVKSAPVKTPKGGPVGFVMPAHLQRLEWFGDSKPLVCRSPQTAIIGQLNLPMLI